MPLWIEIDETGVLRRHRHDFVLELREGGSWRLEIPWWRRDRSMLGKRVRVHGLRVDFDVSAVRQIQPA